jgi:molecular chaperone DnaK
VENAFRVLGAEIDRDEKSKLDEHLAELRAALASGEVQRLKKANAMLDKATEPLAALLVEKAISEAEGAKAASPPPLA